MVQDQWNLIHEGDLPLGNTDWQVTPGTYGGVMLGTSFGAVNLNTKPPWPTPPPSYPPDEIDPPDYDAYNILRGWSVGTGRNGAALLELEYEFEYLD